MSDTKKLGLRLSIPCTHKHVTDNQTPRDARIELEIPHGAGPGDLVELSGPNELYAPLSVRRADLERFARTLLAYVEERQ